jgi:thiamine transport system substrate-binding protein
MNLRYRAAALLFPVVVMSLIAGACGGRDDNAEGGATEPSRRVVLLTYDSFALPESAAERFRELTGAAIEVRAAGDSAEMLTGALLTAGAPSADVIFGVDNTLATRVLAEDLLEPFAPEGLGRVPERFVLDGPAGELLTPVDSGDVCVNVDRSWYEREGLRPPETMEDLTAPEYRSQLVVQSPVTSSPGLAFLIGTVDRYGEDGWPGYWQRLSDNDVRVRPSWDDSYYTDYTVSGGDRPLVLSYASSPPAEVVYGDADEPASSVMTDTCVEQVEYAGVLRGAASPELARQLVEFMLSDVWQESLPLSNFVFPVVDVDLPTEFEQWAERPANPARVAPDVIDARRDDWIEQWRELME